MRYRLAGLLVLILECELSQQQEILDVTDDDQGSYDQIVYVIPAAGILIIAVVGLSYLIYAWHKSRKDSGASDKRHADGPDTQSVTEGGYEFSHASRPPQPPPYHVEEVEVAFKLDAIMNDTDPPPSYSEAVGRDNIRQKVKVFQRLSCDQDLDL